MNGGGGATTSQPSGGSASKGNAPQSIDIANIIAQNNMLKIQERTAEAQAQKAEAEAVKAQAETKTEDETRDYKAESIRQAAIATMYDNDLKEAKAKGFKDPDGEIDINTNWKLKRAGLNYYTDSPEAENYMAETRMKKAESILAEETIEDKKILLATEILNKEIEIRLKKSQKEYTDEQKAKLWHDIWQGWTNAGFNGLGKIINGVLLKGLTK